MWGWGICGTYRMFTTLARYIIGMMGHDRAQKQQGGVEQTKKNSKVCPSIDDQRAGTG